MEKKLSLFNNGESGTVKCIAVEGALRRRLFDMGLTSGAVVTLRKVAPLGDPMELTVRGYELTIRRQDAEQVIMEV